MFRGLEEVEREDPANCKILIKDFIRNTLSLASNAIMFDDVHRVGQRGNANKSREIIAHFGNVSDRQTVWKTRPKNETDRFITQDFPVEIQRRRRLMIPILKFAKLNDAHKDHSYIYSDKLIINERTYTVNDLDPHLISREPPHMTGSRE